ACRVVDGADDDVETGNPVVCLGTPQSNPHVARLLTLAKIDAPSPDVAESYAIDFLSDKNGPGRRILVAGGDAVGCIHGASSLIQLFGAREGKTAVKLCTVRDFPTVSVRSLRGVGESLGMKLQLNAHTRYYGRSVTGDEIHDDALMLPCLDRLARNRINCFHVLAGMENEAELPDRLPHLVAEAHRRGIRVVGGFRPVGSQRGDRSTFPCYTNPDDVAKVLGFFRQYIEAGCDMLYFMADDYYPDKLAGHCPECIARFGNLAGEQQFMLHEILALARDEGFPADRILFCPTHYDVAAGENYLEVFDRDPQLRPVSFTFTYLAEEMIDKRREEYPNVRYALFYNGPRWLAYYHRRGSAATQRALARFARNALYFPIYFGWHSAQYDPEVGWFTGTGQKLRRTFHEVVPRQTARTVLLGNIANYSDSIFKGPVEYALWGHYCWNPEAHDTRQSETAVGDALFGPGNGAIMAKLNRVLLDLTRIVYDDVPLAESFQNTLAERLALAGALCENLKRGYRRYREGVAADYVPATQDFYVDLALDDLDRYLALLHSCARQRGLTGEAPVVHPRPRYSGVAFPSANPDAFFISGGAQSALSRCLGDLYRYVISENRWESVSGPKGVIPPRCGHSAVPVDGKVLVFGGSSKDCEILYDDLYAYD
ncbi:MAG: kelch repeat-containing protein, partial [Planctomycetota bacterium]